MNLDMALAKVGGFGRFQTLATIGLSFLRTSGSVLIYTGAYLVLPQEYKCRFDSSSEFASCSTELICSARKAGDPIEYRVDTSYEFYLNNW